MEKTKKQKKVLTPNKKKKQQTKKQKKGLTPDQRKKQQEQRKFKTSIRTTFSTSGFEYINTDGFHFQMGARTVEVDFLLAYENIILICEETTTSDKRDIEKHLLNKQQAFTEISKNREKFLEIIQEKYPDKGIAKKFFPINRYKFFNLYFTKNKSGLSYDKKEELYSDIKIIEPETLNYFIRMAKCIKKSMRYEMFRYLNIKSSDIGVSSSETSISTIDATIIVPDQNTGLRDGVKMVSFMMSADSLLETAYVMRKDNWQDSTWLYQRLIVPAKILKLREFIAEKGTTFFNNIIVALPDNVEFRDSQNNVVKLSDNDCVTPCKMIIPKEMNSICVIDGQHRIFAHYESDSKDKYEKKIESLRQELHLLVTGLVFDKTMSDLKRSQIQSEIFLDINSNAKPVPADVLLNIEMIKDPFSELGVARKVIDRLNQSNIFYDMFEISTLEKGKIKIASIIKFALRYLISIELENKKSLFYYWAQDKEPEVKQSVVNKSSVEELENYIKFATKNLEIYFSAVKKNYSEYWNKESKLLTVTAINGFILAFSEQLKHNGIRNFEFYDKCFGRYVINFSKEEFRFTSSQYRMFSKQLLEKAFEINKVT